MATNMGISPTSATIVQNEPVKAITTRLAVMARKIAMEIFRYEPILKEGLRGTRRLFPDVF
jgi:hypothetical protein